MDVMEVENEAASADSIDNKDKTIVVFAHMGAWG